MSSASGPDAARRAVRVLRAVWVIVEARQRDGVAAEVARLGEALGAALERDDRAAIAALLVETRAWLATMAGVVTSRLLHALDDDGPAAEPRVRTPGG